MKIKKNKNLAQYTSLNIGGPTDYLAKVKSTDQLLKAIKWAKDNNIKYYVLGKGSNLLISDKGIRGLVIILEDGELEKIDNTVTAEAGVSLIKLLDFCKKHNLSGLGLLAGIPGTVGGAVVSNAGTKKGSISKAIKKVTALNEKGKTVGLEKKQCSFGYRTSIFKNSNFVVLKAVFDLKKEKKEIIERNIKNVLATRKEQPKGKTVGSIFKNPGSYNAGYLIEKAGFKGMRVGGAQVSKKHANWIVNVDNASASDVIKLINTIKKKVKKDFKVNLKEEIVYLGEF